MKQIEIEIDGIIYKTFVRDNEEISLTVEETHYDDEFMDGHGFGFNDRHRRNQREEYEVFPPITGKVVGIIPVEEYVNIKIRRNHKGFAVFLVEATGIEPTTSASRTLRATSCATPRFCLLFFAFSP